MRIAVCQIKTTIGDFEGNVAKILERMRWAEGFRADLCVFPELAICGYPPRDLLEKPEFVRQNLEAVDAVARKAGKMAVVLGFVSANAHAVGRALHNSAGVLHEGQLRFVQPKTLLPEYDVFEEARHFEPARARAVWEFSGVRLGLSICEDLWSPFDFGGRRLYDLDPLEELMNLGADVLINLSASPFTLGKHRIRLTLAGDAARRFGRPLVSCNLVGGNDELVFDGRSFVVDGQGRLVREAAAFAEDAFVLSLDALVPAGGPAELGDEEEVRRALVLGLRDYMSTCGFDRAVVGLSGGIDSAVVAALACEAIGPKKVMGVMMPSPYSSQESVADAEALARNLGMTSCLVPISEIYESYRRTLGFRGGKGEVSLAEENLQARIRGNILMAMSNRERALVLSTGNKSELSVGYCTLYGDMAGGFALISDVPKTMVFALARHLNRDRELIPEAILAKPPSAELKPDQTDQDALPPYELLDPIIRAAVEERLGIDAIVAQGFERRMVERVVRMIDGNEYKRRQAAPGIKVTSKAFGPGRRFPIAWKP